MTYRNPDNTLGRPMLRLRPYASLAALMDALDNGGFILDPLSHRGDGTISKGEVKRAMRSVVAGPVSVVEIALFLGLVASELGDEEQARLRAALADGLADRYQLLLPHPVEPRAVASSERGALVLVDGELRDGTSADKATPFYIPGVEVFSRFLGASRLDLEYRVLRVGAVAPGGGSALLLSAIHAPVPAYGTPIRLAAIVSTLRHDDGSDITYLEPRFYWRKDEPARDAPELDDDVLRVLLAHVPDDVEP